MDALFYDDMDPELRLMLFNVCAKERVPFKSVFKRYRPTVRQEGYANFRFSD